MTFESGKVDDPDQVDGRDRGVGAGGEDGGSGGRRDGAHGDQGAEAGPRCGHHGSSPHCRGAIFLSDPSPIIGYACH